MSERRHSNRREVGVIMNAYQDGIPSLCVAEDLSATGIRIRRLLHGPDPVSRRIRFEFQLPGQRKVITATGRQVREGDAWVGVRFTHLTEADRMRIQNYVGDFSL